MKRFEFLYSLGLAQKINAKVDIPEKIVVKVDGKEEEYQLSSFIHHQGTLKGGHYTAYRKVENTWFFMSDTTVKVADLAEMKEALETSYILCYQRDQGNNPSEEG
jgi:ubiquitin C-terminal hydrolase